MTAEAAATLTPDDFRKWAEDLRGPVALTLRQKLMPVEGDGAVIFPATYAKLKETDPSYNIDKLSDGTCVAQIDSVGSQANRMELIFIPDADARDAKRYCDLVPQIWIKVRSSRPGETAEKTISIMEAGHRLGDAIVRKSGIGEAAQKAFAAWQDKQDAGPIAKLAPTSLVFGAWDSRGKGAKVPRLVSSVIRAWDVEEISRSAQYFPPVRYADYGIFDAEDVQVAEKEAKGGASKNPLAVKGYVEVPAVAKHGGIVARGDIIRTVTVNLVALRSLTGGDDPKVLRSYILGLTLIAATESQSGFLRQGCLLTPDPGTPAVWEEVARNGSRRVIALNQDLAEPFARSAAKAFGVADPITVEFDPKGAKEETENEKKSRKSKGDE